MFSSRQLNIGLCNPYKVSPIALALSSSELVTVDCCRKVSRNIGTIRSFVRTQVFSSETVVTVYAGSVVARNRAASALVHFAFDIARRFVLSSYHACTRPARRTNRRSKPRARTDDARPLKVDTFVRLLLSTPQRSKCRTLHLVIGEFLL